MTSEKKLSPSVEGLVILREFGRTSFAALKLGTKASDLLLKAARVSGEHFGDTVETWYGEIRVDANGMAKACGAERTKDGKNFAVPGSIMAQVSQVLRAMKHGVDLGTAEQPKGLGQIRKATSTAVEKAEEEKTAQAVALLTGDDAVKIALMKALTEAASTIKAASGPLLESLRLATMDYCTDVLRIVAEAKAEAAQAELAAKVEAAAPEAVEQGDAIAEAAEAPRQVAVTVRRSRKAA